LTIDGWRNGTTPTLSGRALSLDPYEFSRSLAIAGRQAFLPRLDFRPHGFRRCGQAEMAMGKPERNFGGER
jgi:hypothetical protein